MKFSCGENWEHKVDRQKKWHPFFPLWPRTIAVENGKDICAWLEWIERKGKWDEFTLWDWEWEYREKQ